MRKQILYSIQSPYRAPMDIIGFKFGGGEKADIAVIKREAKNLEISDTQNNIISINNAFNCVLTVNGNKVRYIDKELCS